MTPDMINLEGLRAFLAVADAGGFLRAEGKLNRTQASISKRISTLENALGVQLFERRGPRPILLTEAGKLLVNMLRPLMGSLDELPSRLAQELSGRPAVLRILTGQSNALHMLPVAVGEFLAAAPRVRLQVSVARSEAILRAVQEEQAELGITTRRPGLSTDLAYLTIMTCPLVAAIGPTHPLHGQRSVTLERLAQFWLVVPDRDSYMRSLIDSGFRKAKLTPKVAVEAGGWDVIKTYAAQGCGIAVLPQRILKAGDDSVTTLEIRPPLPPCQVGVAMRDQTLRDPTARMFLRTLYRTLGSPLPPLLSQA